MRRTPTLDALGKSRFPLWEHEFPKVRTQLSGFGFLLEIQELRRPRVVGTQGNPVQMDMINHPLVLDPGLMGVW